jgi:hypothetical protein
MKITALTGMVLLALTTHLHASQSIITESGGYACMGDDKSRKDTELVAVKDAKRKAAEYAVTHIRTETHVKDSVLEKDLISAYANAEVRVIQELEKQWYKEEGLGECYRVKLKVEVTPDEKALRKVAEKSSADDPTGPLSVNVWTDRKEYRQGQQIKIFLKSNKPFYGRVVYKDADGKLVQLLPNPYRTENYFNGGTVYELPGNGDHYDLEVTPPFGSEGVTVYASSAPLGEIETASHGGILEIRTKPQDIASGTRGIKFSAKGSNPSTKPAIAEFAESKADLSTGGK